MTKIDKKDIEIASLKGELMGVYKAILTANEVSFGNKKLIRKRIKELNSNPSEKEETKK